MGRRLSQLAPTPCASSTMAVANNALIFSSTCNLPTTTQHFIFHINNGQKTMQRSRASLQHSEQLSWRVQFADSNAVLDHSRH
jgi:hypothetical protein